MIGCHTETTTCVVAKPLVLSNLDYLKKTNGIEESCHLLQNWCIREKPSQTKISLKIKHKTKV